MKTCKTLFCLALVLILVSPALADDDARVTDYSLWAGAHYTGFDDYAKKVGEYTRAKDEAFPEFIFSLTTRKRDAFISFDGHYYDNENILARVSATKGDRIDFSAEYISLIHQDGQDMLAALEAREWLGTAPGGKMLTHELTDVGVDYNTTRHQINTRFEALLSKKGNVKLTIAHRSILEKGNEQKLSISHCFSCHVESEEWDVDQATHELEAGIQGRVADFDVGYAFGFRSFKSEVADPTAMWDVAKHPVNGGSGAEFGSRMIYDGQELIFGVYPETQKMSHTGRIRGKLGKGRVSGSIGYTGTENKFSSLESKSLNGNLGYAVPVSDRMRLVAKIKALRMETDNVNINLPTWRIGRPDSNPVNFDYTRFSSSSRTQTEGTLELVTALNKKATLSVLAGVEQIDRWDYPTPQTTYDTQKYTGQARLRYREGLKWSGSVKYRYEHTEDPLHSARGLLERRGREILEPESPNWAFYYQREALRFLDVTMLPTDAHEVDLKGSMRASDDVMVSAGIRAAYDENNDLDTLDVQHLSLAPNVNLMLTPGDGLVLNVGYTFNHARSRGPITIPIFDG